MTSTYEVSKIIKVLMVLLSNVAYFPSPNFEMDLLDTWLAPPQYTCLRNKNTVDEIIISASKFQNNFWDSIKRGIFTSFSVKNWCFQSQGGKWLTEVRKKEQIKDTKKEAKKIKSDNFSRSDREKFNNAIARLEKLIIRYHYDYFAFGGTNNICFNCMYLNVRQLNI